MACCSRLMNFFKDIQVQPLNQRHGDRSESHSQDSRSYVA